MARTGRPKGIPSDRRGKTYEELYGVERGKQKRLEVGISKIGNKNCIGRILSEDSRQKMSEALTGRSLLEETKQKISKSLLGSNNPRFGYVYTEDEKQRMSKACTGLHTGEKNQMFGKTHSEETKNKTRGKNNHAWRGGISFEEYGKEFNNELRVYIRIRDKCQCQICSNIEDNKCHSVHHIDYDKKNNDPSNLITLCRKCHTKTNFNRESWQKQLTQKQIDRGLI